MDENMIGRVARDIKRKPVEDLEKRTDEEIQPVGAVEGGKTKNSTEEPPHSFLGKIFDSKKLGKDQGQNINDVRPQNPDDLGKNINIKV